MVRQADNAIVQPRDIPINLSYSSHHIPPQGSRVLTEQESQLLNAKSVKELWINSQRKPVVTHVQQVSSTRPILFNSPSVHLECIPTSAAASHHVVQKRPENPEGSMIKELLLKTRGTATLSNDPSGRRDSNSSSGSNPSSQFVIQMTRPSMEAAQNVKLSLPHVSLILTPSSAGPVSSVCATSLPMPKVLPQTVITQSTPTSMMTAEFMKVTIKTIYCWFQLLSNAFSYFSVQPLSENV
jgi:hypothetical protein